jgi:hypothetical protein
MPRLGVRWQGECQEYAVLLLPVACSVEYGLWDKEADRFRQQ